MHLAQLNIARLLAPMDDPLIADFKAGIDPMNALAEATPGFVWRLRSDAEHATWLGDPMMLINLSVWESEEALRGYTYRSPHTAFVRRRREWFERTEHFQVLWWIEKGVIPTLAEGRTRLEYLAEQGPSPYAFTFTPTLVSPYTVEESSG